jgi:hypothetical protein
MPRQQSGITAGTQSSHSHMTRAEVVAFFDRRQRAYDNLDAATLAANYADDCTSTARRAARTPAARDRQIVREHRIYDFTGMLTQIGVVKTTPV